MAGAEGRPIKIYGLGPSLSKRLTASGRNAPPEYILSRFLRREEILTILYSNGIKIATIQTKKAEMVRLLHQLLTERGTEAVDPEQEEIEWERQQAEDGVPRPKNCRVCLRRTSTYLFEICRHLCICSACKCAKLRELNASRVWRMNGVVQRQINCPVCRQVHLETQLLRVTYNNA